MSQKGQAFLVASILTLLITSAGNGQTLPSVAHSSETRSKRSFSQTNAAKELIRRPAFRQSITTEVQLDQPQILEPVKATELPTPKPIHLTEKPIQVSQPVMNVKPSDFGSKFASNRFHEDLQSSISTHGFASDRFPLQINNIGMETDQEGNQSKGHLATVPQKGAKPISEIVEPTDQSGSEGMVQAELQQKPNQSTTRPIATASSLTSSLPSKVNSEAEATTSKLPPPPSIMAPIKPNVSMLRTSIPRKQQSVQDRIARQIFQVCGDQVENVGVEFQTDGTLSIQVDVSTQMEKLLVEQKLGRLPELTTSKRRVTVRALR